MNTRYICKCGREVSKSTDADNTGNRDTYDCLGCPYLVAWGEQKYNHDTGHFNLDISGYECRMSTSLSYETRFGGSVEDKRSCYIASLDFDFLEMVSDWIKATYPDGELSGSFSRKAMRACEFVSNGRYRMSITCSQNKAGVAAKAALLQQFFDESGYRTDMTLKEEKQKILCDIQRGINLAAGSDALPVAEQNHEEDGGMVTNYQDSTPDAGNKETPCDRCRCPDCTDYDCDQAGCDKSDCGLGCMAPDDQCPPETDKNYPDEKLVRDKTSSCPYFAGVTSHMLGNKVIENVNCTLNDHPLSIACYTCGCKDDVPGCRIYWFGRIADDLGHEAPEYLKNCPAEDLKKYFEEETEKCNSTPTTSNADPASPADAGLATLSQSDADAASLAAKDINVPATAFDYSGLDAQTVATLHSAETMIRNARKDYVIKVADAVGMVHNELVQLLEGHNQHSEETFIGWCRSVGLGKSTAYNLLQVSNLLDKSTPNEQKILEQAPATLLYAAAKPSAPAEAVAAVKSGDIKSMPEYKVLLEELEAERAAREKAEEARAAAEQEAAEISETAADEMCRANAAEEKVRKLESRPIEVAVQEPDPAVLDRLATEKAQTMTAMYKAQINSMQEQNDDLARQLESSDVERYNHARDTVQAFHIQLRSFRESFWRVAGSLPDEDIDELLANLVEDAVLITENDWSDFEDGD